MLLSAWLLPIHRLGHVQGCAAGSSGPAPACPVHVSDGLETLGETLGRHKSTRFLQSSQMVGADDAPDQQGTSLKVARRVTQAQTRQLRTYIQSNVRLHPAAMETSLSASVGDFRLLDPLPEMASLCIVRTVRRASLLDPRQLEWTDIRMHRGLLILSAACQISL